MPELPQDRVAQRRLLTLGASLYLGGLVVGTVAGLFHPSPPGGDANDLVALITVQWSPALTAAAVAPALAWIVAVKPTVGIAAVAYHPTRRWIASGQKCGGVQTKMMRNSSSAPGSSVPLTATQPSSGGAAPAAPPMTMFCGVRCLR